VVSAEPPWLDWVRSLQAIAQAGLTYASDEYDIERYHAVRRVAAEIASAQSGTPPEMIHGLFAAATGYPTPKVDVRGAVIGAGRILLVRERSDGAWTLPGGWADPGESPSEAVAREVLEEAGVRVRAVKLIALYDRARQGHPVHSESIYKAIFSCQALEHLAPRASGETDAAAFFDADALPELSVGRTTHAQIARVMAHHADPALPTEFD